MKIIYFETGCNERLPLFSYSGCTKLQAENIIREKTSFKHFNVVTPEEIKEKQRQIRPVNNPQWFIYAYQDLVSGDYLD